MDHPERHNGPPDRPHKSKGISDLKKRLVGLIPERWKSEKVRELDRQYQQVMRELEVLTRDRRIENFNGKTPAQNRATYDNLPPDSLANSQTELTYEQNLIHVQAWRDRMKD